MTFSTFAITVLISANPSFSQEAPPVVNGTKTSDYEAVGAFLACSGSWCADFCSGTLIQPKWVLTAGHCVEAMEDDYATKTIYFAIGADIVENMDDYALVRDFDKHPQYYMSGNSIENDVGIVELRTSITSVDWMYVNKDNVNNSWIDDELTYVGYGITSDCTSDSDPDCYTSGYKRYADMPIYTFDSQFIYGLDLEDGQNICSGDSGGAALEKVSNNTYELAGVNSFGFAYESNYTTCEGGGSGAARVDKYISWIEGYTDVYAAEESDSDTDADTDADTDSDSDSDTDSDADSDTDSDSDSDSDFDTGANIDDDPDRPNNKNNGKDEDRLSLCACASTPSENRSTVMWLVLVGLLGFLRRQENVGCQP